MRTPRVSLTPSACPTGALIPPNQPLCQANPKLCVWVDRENPPWLGLIGLSATKIPSVGWGDFNEQVPGPAESDFRGDSSTDRMDSGQQITLKNLIGG